MKSEVGYWKWGFVLKRSFSTTSQATRRWVPHMFLLNSNSCRETEKLFFLDSALYFLVEWTRISMVYMEVSINGGSPKWMVYNGKSYQHRWFRGTPILGNIHIPLTHVYTCFRCCYPRLSIMFDTFVTSSPFRSVTCNRSASTGSWRCRGRCLFLGMAQYVS